MADESDLCLCLFAHYFNDCCVPSCLTFFSLCSTLTHASTACCLHRVTTILLLDSVLTDDFRHWPH